MNPSPWFFTTLPEDCDLLLDNAVMPAEEFEPPLFAE
jgi:hypothetical protein